MSENTTEQEVMQEGISYYAIDPESARLIIKHDYESDILANKQRGVLYQDWLLALLPEKNKPLSVLINIKTGDWTSDMASDFAKSAPVGMMLNELQNYYKYEVTIPNITSANTNTLALFWTKLDF